MKTLSDSYLYQIADCGGALDVFVKQAKRVDKKSDGFKDVTDMLRLRQISPVLLKVLMSNKVVLLMGDPGAPRAFKVQYRKDLEDGVNKAFIDCTGVIKFDENTDKYICKNINTLMSYLISAMTYVIFYNVPNLITTNTTIVQSATEAFTDLMLYVLSYLKVPISSMDNKERMSFIIAEYFLYCIMQKDNAAMNFNVAKKVADIDNKKAEYLHILFLEIFEKQTTNIKDFITKFAEVFLDDENNKAKNKLGLNSEAVVSKWSYAFGPGTFLGLELFVPFTAIITDCYVGGYINNQNTVEKVIGKNVTKFANELIKIGSETV